MRVDHLTRSLQVKTNQRVIEPVQSFLLVLLWIILSFIRIILSYHLECKQMYRLQSSRAYPHQDRGILPLSRLHFYTVYHTRSSSGTLHANNAKCDSNAPRACQRSSINLVKSGGELTFKHKNCAASSIVSGAQGALFEFTFFGIFPSSSSGTSMSACIWVRSLSSVELPPRHARVTASDRASMRPGGKDSGFVRLSQNTLNCGMAQIIFGNSVCV